jgi:hypothetical protein
MPGSKQKRTTAQTPLSTSEFSSHPLPEQQAFHQQLRTLAQSAVRTVIELVMREELDAFIGAACMTSPPRVYCFPSSSPGFPSSCPGKQAKMRW